MNQLDNRYYEEDDIDLMELLRTILKHKCTIIISTLVVAILALVGGMIYNTKNKVSTVTIGFDYPELEKGKNPDGSNFLKSNIIPFTILKSTFENNKDKLKAKNVEEFRNEIIIQPVIPGNIATKIDKALKNGENLNYISSNYKITTTEDKLIFESMIEKTLENYVKKYKRIESVDLLRLIDSYDYNDREYLFENKLNELDKYFCNKISENNLTEEWVNKVNKLRNEIVYIKNTDLKTYSNIVKNTGVTRNIDIYRNNLKREIELKIYEKEKLEKEKSTLKTIIDNYKMNSLLLNEDKISNKSIDVENKYYNELITRYLDLTNKIETEIFEIKQLEELYTKVKVSDENTTEKVESYSLVLEKSINNVVTDGNMLLEEYANHKYSNMIEIVSPVIEMTKGKPVVIYLAGGVVLGVALGIFLAFVLEFRKKYIERYGK